MIDTKYKDLDTLLSMKRNTLYMTVYYQKMAILLVFP